MVDRKPSSQSLPHGYVLHGQDKSYVIDRVLGQGSFGITYLAKYRAQVTGRIGSGTVWVQVCIKEFFMREMSSRDDQSGSLRDSTGNSLVSRYQRAFMREARHLSRMNHPNIVSVFEVFESNNTAYIVMEYKEGGNLDDYIVRTGRIPEKEAIKLFKPLCEAMSYLHAQKMLHLDMKPKNVVLDEEGNVYLIDFGLSKQYTSDGEPESSTTIGLGTPGYAPLEQGKRTTDGQFRTTLDVYALGGTMYKMLTGQTPPEATEISNALFSSSNLILTNLISFGISLQTAEIVSKAMHPASLMRYQSVFELESAFEDKIDKVEDLSPMTNEVEVQDKKEIIQPSLEASSQNETLQTSFTDHETIINKRAIKKKWFLPVLAALLMLFLTIIVSRIWLPKSQTPEKEISNKIETPSVNDSLTTIESFSEKTHNGYEYVDLGLSVMWATCNVGAKNPSDNGDYFAWGETSKKYSYIWSKYEFWISGGKQTNNDVKLNKYNTRAQHGIVDNKRKLEAQDDVACKRWGGNWRIPTIEEWKELQNNCFWEWTTLDSRNGYMVTSKKTKNTIFLPAAGSFEGTTISGKDNYGNYWSATLEEGSPQCAKILYIYEKGEGVYTKTWNRRCAGLSVRPVCIP